MIAENDLIYFGNSPNGWMVQQVQEIEVRYGEGFLTRNPHYPAPGVYFNADGSQSFYGPIPLEQQND